MNTRLFLPALTILAAVTWSCSENEDSPETFKDYAVPYEEGTSERTYMEETATTLLSLIKPDDQKALMISLNQFATKFDTYEFPPEFGEQKSDVVNAVMQLARSLEEGNIADLAPQVRDLAFTLSNYQGLYQANDNMQQWQKIEDADFADFRYWVNGTENNLIVKGDGGVWTESVVTDNGTYTVNMPKQLMITLNQGVTSSVTPPTQRLMATINTDGKDNSHLTCSADITAENILVNTTITASNSKYTERLTIYVDNTSTHYRTTAIDASIEATGQNLCSIAAWQAGDSHDPGQYVGSMVGSASTTVMIMGRVQVKAQVSDFATLIDNTMARWSTATDASAQARASEAAAALEKCANAATYYAGKNSTKARATSGWEAYRINEYGTAEVWGVRPTMTFTADDATYDIAGYFTGGGRFYTVETQIRSLLKTYKSYWK